MTDAFASEYTAFFQRATGGLAPHAYQVRIATGERLPTVVEVPPGLGKTAAIVLAWIWRRLFHPEQSVRTATPRRLILALPMRTLTDQAGQQVQQWLERLGLSPDVVGLHVIMGGRGKAARPWRSAPERESIVVGTIDMITSKALVRAYGAPRHVFPMDSALVWNDAHIVVDEVQQAPATTTTLRQIDAFRRHDSVRPDVAPPSAGLTCMSATIPHDIIDTVDNPWPDESQIVRLGPDDDTDDIALRRAATRTIYELDADAGDLKAVAAHAAARHRKGRLTLAIVNTVRSAKDLARAVSKLAPSAEVVLLHSQFRPVDRAYRIAKLTEVIPPEGLIVVSTQVVEAGIDIDADVLITEAAPWSSLVQRSGRCNRAGRSPDAELWWIEPAKPLPYEGQDIDACVSALTQLEARSVTNEQLLGQDVKMSTKRPATLRRDDFYALFDTSSDLSGHDLDIAPYVHDGDDLSVQLCWMSWDGEAPPPDIKPLAMDFRCRIPVGEVSALVKANRPVWRLDPVAARWRRVDARSPARPGEVLLSPVEAGGYRTDTGFDPSSNLPVELPETTSADSEVPLEDFAASDVRSFGEAWVSLDQHLTETEDQARVLVAALDLPTDQALDVVLAARVHDVGKAHPIWQDALCATGDASERSDVDAGRPWAKSRDPRRQLRYRNPISSFRHELASVALLDGPLSSLVNDARDRDLVRYLVLAHHGKLRVQIRDPHPVDADTLFGLIAGATEPIPSVLDAQPSVLQASLERFRFAGGEGFAGWADVVADLLNRYGVFQLAYLETLVRIADWRASALHDRKVALT